MVIKEVLRNPELGRRLSMKEIYEGDKNHHGVIQTWFIDMIFAVDWSQGDWVPDWALTTQESTMCSYQWPEKKNEILIKYLKKFET